MKRASKVSYRGTRILIISLSLVFLFCAKEKSERPTFGLVVHGGAGTILRKNMTPEREKNYRLALTQALSAGYGILEGGGSSLDAVETVVRMLEDSPLFNAGKGAVFTDQGTNELDASIMDGSTLNAGAVAAVKHIKNPVSLARLVMEKSPHVLMVGEGAEAFAREQGIELVPRDYFYTEKRWKQWQGSKKKKSDKPSSSMLHVTSPPVGTVGATALDKNGNLAAATSTGGLTNKKFGRVGDSPLIGAGTYADNGSCAVSGTGHGEYFMRFLVAYDISSLMTYRGLSLNEAVETVIMQKLTQQGGSGGVIAIDRKGNVSMKFNTEGMYRGFMVENQDAVVKIYKE
ncbi:MAG: isoaspartyl peptidase/L-asparaginase [Candidatus Neomarinimicrobiota bacterium]